MHFIIAKVECPLTNAAIVITTAYKLALIVSYHCIAIEILNISTYSKCDMYLIGTEYSTLPSCTRGAYSDNKSITGCWCWGWLYMQSELCIILYHTITL